MTLVVLMMSLLYGDYHSGIRHLPKMMGGLDNFLTVLVIHCSWNGLASCMSSGNGKKPYDFLITRCCRHPIFALLHGALMFFMGFPWYYGIKNHFFTPWSAGPAKLELYSYYLRAIVVTIFGLIFSNACLMPKDRQGKSFPRPKAAQHQSGDEEQLIPMD